MSSVIAQKPKRTRKVSIVLPPKEEEVVQQEVVPEVVVEEVIVEEDVVVEKDHVKQSRFQRTRDALVKVLEEGIALVQAEQAKLSKPSKALQQIEKRFVTANKYSAKLSKVRVRVVNDSSTPKPASGLQKPIRISPAIAAFAGWNPDELKSRNDVTKYLCNYIKEKQLKDPNDGRRIAADGPLIKLLNLKPDDILTYTSLQQFLKPHYV
jgi:chromatin remodeling complex protein RSC6